MIISKDKSSVLSPLLWREIVGGKYVSYRAIIVERKKLWGGGDAVAAAITLSLLIMGRGN